MLPWGKNCQGDSRGLWWRGDICAEACGETEEEQSTRREPEAWRSGARTTKGRSKDPGSPGRKRMREEMGLGRASRLREDAQKGGREEATCWGGGKGTRQ